MPESHRLYLDQMLGLDVAMALRDQGHDILRASEVGQARSDNFAILQEAIAETKISLLSLSRLSSDIYFFHASKGRQNTLTMNKKWFNT